MGLWVSEMRYMCECGAAFEKEECYEGACPYCGGGGYEKEGRCVLCASAVPDSEVEPGGLCPECAGNALARFRAAIANSNLQVEELEYIDSVIEGNSLTDLMDRRE